MTCVDCKYYTEDKSYNDICEITGHKINENYVCDYIVVPEYYKHNLLSKIFLGPPKNCPDCGAEAMSTILDDDWENKAAIVECIDESKGTIGFDTYCYNCGRNQVE